MIEIKLKKALHAASGPMELAVQLEIAPGEFLAITGPSGSGKTTLLRLIAGLAQPEEGYIKFEERVWLDTAKKIALRPQERNIGLVFQDYALFPNMTVRQNLEYALGKGQNRNIIDELIEITELKELEKRYPARLSGGQQQRVALARSLVRQPRILLLDEPLSALDTGMRAKLQHYILRVHEAYQLTTILVSHDQREVFKLSSRIIALHHGRISQPALPPPMLLSNGHNGDFQLSGEVLDIEAQGDKNIVKVLIGANMVRIEALPEETRHLQPGDTTTIRFDAYRSELLL